MKTFKLLLILSLWGFISSLSAQTPDLYIRTGFRKFEQGDTAGSFLYLNKAILLDPQSPKGWLERGRLYSFANNLQSAFRDLDTAILKDPKYSPTYLLRAHLYEKMGQQELAVRDISRYILANPRDIDGYTYKINLWVALNSDRSVLLTADDLVNNNTDLGVAWKIRAQLREKYKDPIGAISDYDKALTLLKNDSICLHRLSILCFESGDMKNTVLASTNFLNLYPNHAELWFNLSEAQASLQDTLGSLNTVRKAVRVFPGEALLWFTKGYYELIKGDWNVAVQDFSTTLLLNFEEKNLAHFNRGLALLYLKKNQEACADFTIASTGTPAVTEASEYLLKYCK